MADAFDELIWQNGHLIGLATRLDKRSVASVQIQAMLYPQADASNRCLVEITCQGVSRVSSTLDVVELRHQHWTGHISRGQLKDGVLWVYLSDGFIEVRAEAFAWAWSSPSRPPD